ncbi:MAG: DUF4397 domain-containing protein [Gemmatimonadaceae bacterium]
MSQHFKLTRIKRLTGYRTLSRVTMLAGVAAIGGCNADSNVAPAPPQGLVQFINAASRYSSVDLNVDSTDVAAGQAYGSGTSVNVAAKATPQQFLVNITGDTTVLATSMVQVSDKSVYTVILTQRVVGAGLLVLPDTVTAPSGNTANLRVINASPSAGLVDVYITGTDTTLANPVSVNLPIEGISPYVNVPVGAGRVRVTAAGTTKVLLDIDATTLHPGQVRTVLMIDSPGGGLPVVGLAIPDLG